MTNTFAGSGIPRQTDIRSADSVDVVQFAANMDPDTHGDTAEPDFIPVLYRLKLGKISRGYKSLEAEVSEM